MTLIFDLLTQKWYREVRAYRGEKCTHHHLNFYGVPLLNLNIQARSRELTLESQEESYSLLSTLNIFQPFSHFSHMQYNKPSVPRRPSHHILWRRFSASSALRKPTPAHRTSLSTQHIRPSAVFDRWSDGLELAAWRTQRPGVWFWQF